MLKRLIVMAMLCMTGPVPAAAQQIAAEFAQIDSCTDVDAFAARNGRHPAIGNYRDDLARLRRNLCRPRSAAPARASRQQRSAAASPGRGGSVTGGQRRRPQVARPMAPPPQPRAAPVYLSAQQLGDLYRSSIFCYDYRADNTCSQREFTDAQYISATEIRMVHDFGYDIAEGQRARLSAGAPFTAEAMQVRTAQINAVQGNQLCRRRSQRILDAYRTEYKLQEHSSPVAGTRVVDMSAEVLDTVLNEDAEDAANSPGTLTCSRYRRDPGQPGNRIVEEYSQDGRVVNTSVITLLPRNGAYPELHW